MISGKFEHEIELIKSFLQFLTSILHENQLSIL